jgi:hypothetical protein
LVKVLAGAVGCTWLGFDCEGEGGWDCCPNASAAPSSTNVEIFADLMNKPMIFNRNLTGSSVLLASYHESKVVFGGDLIDRFLMPSLQRRML